MGEDVLGAGPDRAAVRDDRAGLLARFACDGLVARLAGLGTPAGERPVTGAPGGLVRVARVRQVPAGVVDQECGGSGHIGGAATGPEVIGHDTVLSDSVVGPDNAIGADRGVVNCCRLTVVEHVLVCMSECRGGGAWH
nr:hypothetical protein [Streptomyces kebangsaanensis]